MSRGTFLTWTSQCDKKKSKAEQCEVNIVFNKQTSVRELTLVWGWRMGEYKAQCTCVEVGGHIYLLHKVPLYSRSRKFYITYRSGSKSTVQKLSSNMLTSETKGLTKQFHLEKVTVFFKHKFVKKVKTVLSILQGQCYSQDLCVKYIGREIIYTFIL